MRLSNYFLPVLKENPSEAKIKSHQLMLRSGMVRQSASGIYSWLPLGLKVLKNIENIVRDEQNKAGAIELLMPTIQSADAWKESGRYDDYGKEMLRIKDRQDRDLLYGPTNEELITQIFRDNIKSYKNLPLLLYHIQWKFRDEIRPRFGVMRCREFLMKDTYSFDVNKQDAENSYKKMFLSYLKTFDRLDLKAIPMRADAGPIGGDLSHEFIILADTGESEVFLDKNLLDINIKKIDYDQNNIKNIMNKYENFYSATDEKHNIDQFNKLVDKKNQLHTRGIEVGHIFYFGDKYSKSLKAAINTKEGKNTYPQMGSYGIGVSRLPAAIIEAKYNNQYMKWPKSITPFKVTIINLGKKGDEVDKKSDDIYHILKNNNFDPLLDDLSDSPSSKFKNHDLIGIPFQIIIGSKMKKEEYEFKELGKNKIILSKNEIINRLKEIYESDQPS
ncbi:MAG: proline--tRNA ligase [Candidatus Pelagibacter sp.]|nr:proline--tRNA ligase [Candidatus Pelagibacter sp.]OUV87308.1 MAG: proline--tRNA ligase [Pelagibacteraceae bacterium TMED136]|tara:strand:+ start:27551 stop:28885 length:1335 start_codon:yes stop_codon:yes gene_type:complete